MTTVWGSLPVLSAGCCAKSPRIYTEFILLVIKSKQLVRGE